MMTMNFRKCFYPFDTVPFSTQFILLQTQRVKKPTRDSYTKDIFIVSRTLPLHGALPLILNMN
jgi:hypothetical protein